MCVRNVFNEHERHVFVVCLQRLLLDLASKKASKRAEGYVNEIVMSSLFPCLTYLRLCLQ